MNHPFLGIFDPLPVAVVVLAIILAFAWWMNRAWTRPQKPPSGDHWVRPVQLPPDED